MDEGQNGSKSVKKSHLFQGKGDPRNGHGPAPGAPNAGRPPDWFRQRMGELATRDQVQAFLTSLLTRPQEMECPECHKIVPTQFPGDPELFLKALDRVLDRWMGKPGQELAVNFGNLTADERRARITEILAMAEVRES